MLTCISEHLKLMEFHDVPDHQWSKYLGLTQMQIPDANLVYMVITMERKHFDTLKEALYMHYRISQETYQAKMLQVPRKRAKVGRLMETGT